MEQFFTRKVMHGGTYNAQPVAMAATVATLRALADGQVHQRLEQRGQRLMDGIAAALAEADIPARIQGFPQIFHVAFGISTPITDYRSSLAADKPRYVRFTTALLNEGVRAGARGLVHLRHPQRRRDRRDDRGGRQGREDGVSDRVLSFEF